MFYLPLSLLIFIFLLFLSLTGEVLLDNIIHLM